jgi:hypothetical protein
VLTKGKVTKQKLTGRKPPQPTIKLAEVTRTAGNIIRKMGGEGKPLAPFGTSAFCYRPDRCGNEKCPKRQFLVPIWCQKKRHCGAFCCCSLPLLSSKQKAREPCIHAASRAF